MTEADVHEKTKLPTTNQVGLNLDTPEILLYKHLSLGRELQIELDT